MKRVLRILFVIGFLLIALVVAGVAVLSSMDFNQYKGLIAEQASDATGRKLIIDGELELNISLNPSVSVDGVSFANASWGSKPEMLTLERFAAEISLIPLLSGDIQVKRVVLYGADLLLETDSAGHGNWEFNSTSTESDDTDYGEGEALPVVHNVLVRDVNVQFLDGVNGQTHKFTLTNLDLSTDGIDTPLSLAMEAIYNNENISVEGEMGSVAALSSDGMFPVKLEISSLGARVQLNGTVKKPRSASGVNIGFDVTGDDMAAIASRGMAMAGVDGSASLPEKSIALKGALRDVDGGFAIDGLGMKIGDSDLAGNISFNLAGIRPSVIADLSSNHFDSVDIQPTPSQGNTTPDTGPDDGRVFPDDPISLDGLNSVDASVKFSGKDVVTNGVTLGNVDADLTLKNGN